MMSAVSRAEARLGIRVPDDLLERAEKLTDRKMEVKNLPPDYRELLLEDVIVETCMRTPCDPRCPNAPDPPAIYTCKHCGEPIVPGDEFYEVDGDYYHDDCFTDCAADILVSRFGAVKGVAEEERW